MYYDQSHTTDLTKQIKKVSHRLNNSLDLDALIKDIGSARYVLLGEASHGTHEYYTWRTQLSKRLILEKGFSIIAVEGDWPDCYRINRYIKNYPGSGENAKDVLHSFNRWPTWMWANWETAALVEWLRQHNAAQRPDKRVGFYGLDVYSLWESMDAIKNYLQKADPSAVKAVQEAMDCFEPFNVREGFSYAERTYGLTATCRREVEKLLKEIRLKMTRYDGDPEAAFNAEQNALIAVNAERYYHTMMQAGESSWNIRDLHMSETIDRLMNFYGGSAKMIVWEHNTHIGDARATSMKQAGLINVGQVVKEQHGSEGVYRVGFGSFEGNVLAAHHWGTEVQRMNVPKAIKGSWEHSLQNAGAYDKYILSKDIKEFNMVVGHRAIGVVYDPAHEYGNYVPSIIPSRYEAFVFLQETQALHALHVKPNGLQMPETYPWGV